MTNKADNEAPTKKVEAAKSNKDEAKDVYKRGIIGTLMLLVFGSIVFSSVVIWTGTDDLLYKYLIAPQATFALFIAFVAFSKILK